MNEVKLSGVITEGPRFRELSACTLVGIFVLHAGERKRAVHVIRVIAKGPAAVQLQQFAEGEMVKVSGRLSWPDDGGVEIFAEEFKQHHEGVYDAESLAPKLRPVKQVKTLQRHW